MKSSKFSALLLALLASTAFAQSWPDKPVRLVLSQPPGSGPDNIARILSDSLTRKMGQSIVVDNKPGGQNAIGAQNAARSPADGYTFYLATTAALVTNVYLFKSLPYDPQKDFAAVGFIGKSPFAILVEANSPIKSIAGPRRSRESGARKSLDRQRRAEDLQRHDRPTAEFARQPRYDFGALRLHRAPRCRTHWEAGSTC